MRAPLTMAAGTSTVSHRARAPSPTASAAARMPTARNTGTVRIARDEAHETAGEQVESGAIATLSSSACAPSSSPGRMCA
jgi:hypothetical protein